MVVDFMKQKLNIGDRVLMSDFNGFEKVEIIGFSPKMVRIQKFNKTRTTKLVYSKELLNLNIYMENKPELFL